MQPIAYSGLGVKHTDEAKAKIKTARAKQTFTPESIKKAADSRRGKTPNWKPETIQKHINQLKNMDREKLNTPQMRQRMVKGFKDTLRKKGKPFRCDQTGEVFTLTTDAANALNIGYKYILLVLSGKRKSTHGFTFTYLP